MDKSPFAYLKRSDCRSLHRGLMIPHMVILGRLRHYSAVPGSRLTGSYRRLMGRGRWWCSQRRSKERPQEHRSARQMPCSVGGTESICGVMQAPDPGFLVAHLHQLNLSRWIGQNRSTAEEQNRSQASQKILSAAQRRSARQERVRW